MSKPILSLIFRDKRSGNHSIERLFETMIPFFEEVYHVRRITLPEQPSGLSAICRNIWFALRRTQGICHVTGDAQYLATFLPGKSTVLTIHDCGYLMKLTGLKRMIYKMLWFSLPCYRAGVVTAISDSTKEVLTREIGDLGKKLQVLENCMTLEPSEPSKTFEPTCPKILQIGSGHVKNLDTLIKSVEGLNCKLHIVGKISEDNLHDLEAKGVAFQNEFAVTDERLKEIYSECDILFFASRHEGFGLPILEGQAAGLPVITSTCYSMPKVSGGAALLVNPESATEIRAAINKICNDSDLREHLLQAGKENLERYAPRAIAQKYLNLYSRIRPGVA